MTFPYLPRIELQGEKLHFEILENLVTKTSMTSKPLTLQERFKMTSKVLKVAGTTHHKTTCLTNIQLSNHMQPSKIFGDPCSNLTCVRLKNGPLLRGRCRVTFASSWGFPGARRQPAHQCRGNPFHKELDGETCIVDEL